ncbi:MULTISPECIES: CDP-diacylglycerol--serine O-phosphatidyltransferase [unclassified Acinetobacter]|uniref:CDP-diacylglycerol--serine O-phosphatidyltransferase n=1 Tax=unclassified Acinetobacter TaxID=196816 RepID=UPI0035B71025
MNEPNHQTPQKDEENFDSLTFEVVEEEHTAQGKVRRRGIYLVPNLITTAALLCGFYSIIASMNGDIQKAIYAIIIAALLDGLDGRVARAMNAQSAFGEQFDSLSDMLAFGVAPAMLMYSWSLTGLNRFGLMCCFVYTACAAFRLARFNVQIGSVDKRYFIGIASPLAAIVVLCTVWVQRDFAEIINFSSPWVLGTNAVVMVVVGLLMVSNLKYYSFKVMDKKRVPFVMMIPVVLIFSAITYNIPLGLLSLAIAYVISGFITTWMARKKPVVAKA